MTNPPKFVVRVIETATGTVVKTIGPEPERAAQKIARGVEINLDHVRFHVTVEPEGGLHSGH
jgi:hypothetical protein